jgi:aspartate/methionine/tyrosine aminotransferase
VKLDLSPSPFELKKQSVLNELRKAKKEILDLTISSPMQAGIVFNIAEDLHYLAENPQWQFNAPSAQGQIYAREAVAKYHNCNAENVWITASSSESYLTLFKLLCENGDCILTPSPGYPLIDSLARLSNLNTHPYFLKPKERKWEIDFDSFYSAPPNAKILLLIAPHNPTGHSPSQQEWQNILAFCEERSLALIIDEVFGAYKYCESFSLNYSANVPIFRLDGLSKSLGLAYIKVGWIRTEGNFKDFDALEYILDASLSASYLSQAIAARALPRACEFQKMLIEKLKANQAALCSYFSKMGAKIIPANGGWYQSFYFDGADDEELCLRLLKEHGILTQPGFLFDFPDGYLVASLLQENLKNNIPNSSAAERMETGKFSAPPAGFGGRCS